MSTVGSERRAATIWAAAGATGAALGPAEVLRRVNGRLSRDFLAQGLFLTVGYALLDPATEIGRAHV